MARRTGIAGRGTWRDLRTWALLLKTTSVYIAAAFIDQSWTPKTDLLPERIYSQCRRQDGRLRGVFIARCISRTCKVPRSNGDLVGLGPVIINTRFPPAAACGRLQTTDGTPPRISGAGPDWNWSWIRITVWHPRHRHPTTAGLHRPGNIHAAKQPAPRQAERRSARQP